MEYIYYKKSLKKYISEVFFYRITIILLIVFCLILTSLLYKKDRMLIISPPNIVKNMTIHQSYAELDYLQEMGLYFSILIGNLNSRTSDFVVNTLRKHMVTGLKSAIKDSLISQITLINEKNYETVFNILNVEYKKYKNNNNKYIFVKGLYKIYLNNEKISEKEITYAWDFKIRDWFIYINDFIIIDSTNKGEDRARIKF